MENQSDGISVIILEKDIQIIRMENVKVIRIKSSNYNLLIMKDYLPVVGEIDGSIVIEGDDTVTYDHIKAIYTNAKNKFYLLVKEK